LAVTPSLDSQTLVRSAVAALQRGNPREARRLIEQVTATGRASVETWLVQGLACKAMGDMAAVEQVADAILGLQQNNLRGLLLKGDGRAAAGDRRAAASFYQFAVGRAQGTQLAPDVVRELNAAVAYCADATDAYRDYLDNWLADAGVGISGRFAQSLDLLLGKKEVYFQQPTVYYFPGLPQIQFYEREQFDWVGAIEAQTDVIRQELEGLLTTEEGFSPYVVAEHNRPAADFHGLNDNPKWSALHLYQKGVPVAENIARAPLTFEALQLAPLCHCAKRTPSLMFSLLRGGAKIPPHTGMLNTRLICHLPLIVPRGCGFRVGNEVREWEVGKLLIFDDSIEHEAWNDSDEDRVILLFDIWRPELSDDERAAVTAIFEGIDAYGIQADQAGA